MSSVSEAWQHQRILPQFLMFMVPSFPTMEPWNNKPLLRLRVQSINSLSLVVWGTRKLAKFPQPCPSQCHGGRAAPCYTCCEELSGTPLRAPAVGYHSPAVQWPETRDIIRRHHDKKSKGTCYLLKYQCKSSRNFGWLQSSNDQHRAAQDTQVRLRHEFI